MKTKLEFVGWQEIPGRGFAPLFNGPDKSTVFFSTAEKRYGPCETTLRAIFVECEDGIFRPVVLRRGLPAIVDTAHPTDIFDVSRPDYKKVVDVHARMGCEIVPFENLRRWAEQKLKHEML